MIDRPQALILMGVSGSGKTAVGELLSQKLGWPFFDGDDFHPKENVAKMAAGIPLDDQDRIPWLVNLRDLIDEQLADIDRQLVELGRTRSRLNKMIDKAKGLNPATCTDPNRCQTIGMKGTE